MRIVVSMLALILLVAPVALAQSPLPTPEPIPTVEPVGRIPDPININFSPEWLTLAVGALLSLATMYMPGYSSWFGSLDPVHKRLVMACASLILSVAVLAGGCLGVVSGVECGPPGVMELIIVLASVLGGSQTTYMIVKPMHDHGLG